MADKRVKDYTEVATFATDDKMVLDSTSRGTKSFDVNSLTLDSELDAALLTKEDISNKEVLVLDTSSVKYPCNKLVKEGLDLKADDSLAVHLAGTETITGAKTFSSDITNNANSILANTTYTNQNGIIYKDSTRFLHDFNYGNNGTITTIGNNIFLGNNAGNFTMGSTATDTLYSSRNIGIGTYALTNNTDGYYNVATGNLAMRYNTTGYSNSAVGVSSLSNNTTGYYNTAVGQDSLLANTSGNSNIAIGLGALYSNTTASTNSVVGTNAFYNNTTGYGNVGFGHSAGFANTTGSYNTGIGVNSLRYNTTGDNTVSLGASSLYRNTTGNANIALGVSSLYENTTGEYNIGVGTSAGRFITGGSTANQTSTYSIYLGGSTKALADGDTNEIVIGYNATGNGSNTATYGNTSITDHYMTGNLSVSGAIIGEQYGVCAYLDTPETTTITTAGTYQYIEGDFLNCGIENFTLITLGSGETALRYDGIPTLIFKTNWNASIEANANGTTVKCSVAKNGTTSTDFEMSTFCKNANEVYNLSGVVPFELETNDYLQLVLTSDGTGDVITVDNYTTSISRFLS